MDGSNDVDGSIMEDGYAPSSSISNDGDERFILLEEEEGEDNEDEDVDDNDGGNINDDDGDDNKDGWIRRVFLLLLLLTSLPKFRIPETMCLLLRERNLINDDETIFDT